MNFLHAIFAFALFAFKAQAKTLFYRGPFVDRFIMPHGAEWIVLPSGGTIEPSQLMPVATFVSKLTPNMMVNDDTSLASFDPTEESYSMGLLLLRCLGTDPLNPGLNPGGFDAHFFTHRDRNDTHQALSTIVGYTNVRTTDDGSCLHMGVALLPTTESEELTLLKEFRDTYSFDMDVVFQLLYSINAWSVAISSSLTDARRAITDSIDDRHKSVIDTIEERHKSVIDTINDRDNAVVSAIDQETIALLSWMESYNIEASCRDLFVVTFLFIIYWFVLGIYSRVCKLKCRLFLLVTRLNPMLFAFERFRSDYVDPVVPVDRCNDYLAIMEEGGVADIDN